MTGSELTSSNGKERRNEQKTRILFLSASPEERDRLQVVDECNSVEDAIKSARKYSDLFDLRQRHEFSITKLQEYLIDQDPKIVHFSGHGDEEGVILFQEGEKRKASGEAIANLFGILNQDKNPNDENRIRCVILNACFSEKLAIAIAKHVDCVIGMSKEISDYAAKAFTVGFYYSLASGHDIKKAYEFGCNKIELLSPLPEQKIPQLVSHEGVDPKKVVFVSGITNTTGRKSTESVHKRRYHTFLSRAYVDKTIADNLHQWLRGALGDDHIYYHDPEQTDNNSTVLVKRIPECRSIIILVSGNSVSNGWVREEYSRAFNQRTLFSEFKIIPVLIGECDKPKFLDRESLIEFGDSGLDLEHAKKILHRIYYRERKVPEPGQARDLYISRGWRDEERPFAEEICKLLEQKGFRLIGEAEDREEYDSKRVKSIISGCAGLVAIVPYRENVQEYEYKYKTSKYIINEIVIAQSIRLPTLIIADRKLFRDLEEIFPGQIIPLSMNPAKDTEDETLKSEISRITEEWKKPQNMHYVFFAIDLDDNKRRDTIRNHIQLITSMPCKMATEYKYKPRDMIDDIPKAYLVIADISDNNLTNLIGASIALGAGIARGEDRDRLQLIARRSTDGKINADSILNDIGIEDYADDTELLQKVHQIAYEFRRGILNYELPSTVP